MSNWIPITLATLNEAKIAALVDACSTAALGDGQDDRAAGIIQGVVDHVRRKVGSCAQNSVDADETTVPKGLRDLTVTLILAKLKNAIEMEMTEDEANAVARCERDLNRVAECRDKVDQADTPVAAEVEGGSSVATITSTARQASRDTLSGL